MEFEQELREEEAMETTTIEIEMELQVEENVALATRLSTLVGNEGKKKKKRFGQKLLGEVKEHIPKDARVEKKKKALKSKKRKRERCGNTQPLSPLRKKVKGKEKVVETPPKAAKGKEKAIEKLPAKAKGKEKVIEKSLKKEEGRGRRRQFPNQLLEMGFFPEDTPILTYILEIIDHHGWQDFCAGLSIMQLIVVWAFFEGNIDQKEDMVVTHGCEVPFNARKINTMFSLRDNSDAKGNKMIASTSDKHMQGAI